LTSGGFIEKFRLGQAVCVGLHSISVSYLLRRVVDLRLRARDVVLPLQFAFAFAVDGDVGKKILQINL
jgi:hypothetical protein